MMEAVKISGAPCVSISIRLRYDRNGNTFYRVQRSDWPGFESLLNEGWGSPEVRSAYRPMRIDANGVSPNDALRAYVSRILDSGEVPPCSWWAAPWLLSEAGKQKCGRHSLPSWVAISTGGVQ
jgi:hypothetical protein